MKTLNELPTVNRPKVFLRADLDVEMENGKVIDDFRLKKILPTIQFLLERQCSIILAGHRGRPHGKPDSNLSLKPIEEWFKQQGLPLRSDLQREAETPPQAEAKEGQTLQKSLSITLLENLRFDIREEQNDPHFAKGLASLADVYVNEAFASSYEEHASIVGIPKLLPSYAGLQFEKEVKTLSQVLENPKRPLTILIAGIKPEKAQMIEPFSRIADKVLVAGKIAGFIKGETLQACKVSPFYVSPSNTLDGHDIDPQTLELFINLLKVAQTIVWAGPLGKYEEQIYSKGTREIAEYLLNANDKSLIVIGGGDTIAALHQFGLLEEFEEKSNCFISTGGGAMLQFLVQKTLPGIEALNASPLE